MKLKAPAVRRDGKRVYWMEVMEVENESAMDIEIGCLGGSVWCSDLLLKMLKKIANGRFGAFLGLPKYEI